jgi:hypothetical protein
MKKLPFSIGNLPSTDIKLMKALLKKILHATSADLRELVEYALRFAAFQGLEDDTPIAFLNGEVRYHLECDLAQGIITPVEFERLNSELNRSIARLKNSGRRAENYAHANKLHPQILS